MAAKTGPKGLRRPKGISQAYKFNMGDKSEYEPRYWIMNGLAPVKAARFLIN